MAKRVREPIQVYLSEEERARLDRAAGALGVSRSEVLRRGLEAVSAGSATLGPLRDLVSEGVASPALDTRSDPPPRVADVAFDRLLRGLEEDRSDR